MGRGRGEGGEKGVGCGMNTVYVEAIILFHTR